MKNKHPNVTRRQPTKGVRKGRPNLRPPTYPKHYEDLDTGVVFTCPVCKEEHRIIHKNVNGVVKHGFE